MLSHISRQIRETSDNTLSNPALMTLAFARGNTYNLAVSSTLSLRLTSPLQLF